MAVSVTGSGSAASASTFELGINKMNLFQHLTHTFGVLPNGGLSDTSSNFTQFIDIITNVSSQTVTDRELTYSSQLDMVKETAEAMAVDVLLNFDLSTRKNPPNKYCKTMRRVVKELSDRHDLVFKGMITRLKSDNDDFFPQFVIIADELFADGQVNWGRIVAVYTFAARFANCYREDTSSSHVGLTSDHQQIAQVLGKYVASKLGQWIVDHGGWDAFVEFFPDQGEFEERMWKGLLFTAIGFGALASVMISR